MTPEQAFKKGYDLAAERARAFHPVMIQPSNAHRDEAWRREEFLRLTQGAS